VREPLDSRFVERVKVRITKIDAVENPLSPSSTWEDWRHGKPNSGSLPIDYQLVGYLLRPIRLHESLLVLRIERNGVQAFGIFCTTPVASFEQGILMTQNSVYCLEIISSDMVKRYPYESSAP